MTKTPRHGRFIDQVGPYLLPTPGQAKLGRETQSVLLGTLPNPLPALPVTPSSELGLADQSLEEGYRREEQAGGSNQRGLPGGMA